MNHFYVTLLSDSAQDLYPNNTIAAFQTQLAKPLDLGSGDDKWEVGLCEFAYPVIKPPPGKSFVINHTFIYCDVIAPQLVGTSLTRCLRIIQLPSSDGHNVFNPVYYLPVEKQYIQTITVDILTKLGERVPFPSSKKPSMLVLHFRKVPQ